MTLQTDLQTAVTQTMTDSNILHQIVHGDINTSVTTEGGIVKSIAKVISENTQLLSDSISTLTTMRDEAVASASAAAISETSCSVDALQVTSDLIITDNNANATNDDVTTTTSNKNATAADVITTNNNVIQTSADATTTNDNVIITNADVLTTISNKDATALDVIVTNADVVTSNNSVIESTNWAKYAENVLVPEGNMVDDYSAFHWAQKAQASATGTLTYQGAWDASAGSYPSSPAMGQYYKVSVEGTVSPVIYNVGDSIIYNGSDWDKIDNTDGIDSVFGRTGAVTANAGDYSIDQICDDMTWDNTKKYLGIGTATPTGRLSLAAATSASTLVLGRYSGYASIVSSAGTNLVMDAPTSSEAVYINNYSAANTFIGTGGGRVGVGMITPSEKLTVEGAIALDEIAAPNNTVGYGKLYVKSSDKKLYFKDSAGVESDLLSGGGKVLNTYYVSKTDTLVTNSSSYVDITGLFITLTPVSPTSKFILMGQVSAGIGCNRAAFRFTRNASPVGVATVAGSRTSATSGSRNAWLTTAPLLHRDEPATPSAITYGIQGVATGACYLFINRDESDPDSSDGVRAISSLMILEIEG